MSAKKPEKGLRLTLGHAPASPHIVPGLRGFFSPDEPTPLGGDGELSVDDAKAYIAAHADRVAEARKAWDEFEAEKEANGERPNGRIEFAAPPCPVELVDLTDAQARKARETQADLALLSRRLRRQLRGNKLDGAEAVLAHHEKAAAGGEEG